MQNKTFAIIKPDAIENRFMGKIIDLIIRSLMIYMLLLSENFELLWGIYDEESYEF